MNTQTDYTRLRAAVAKFSRTMRNGTLHYLHLELDAILAQHPALEQPEAGETADTTSNAQGLPSLPPPCGEGYDDISHEPIDYFSAAQMRNYARRALSAAPAAPETPKAACPQCREYSLPCPKCGIGYGETPESEQRERNAVSAEPVGLPMDATDAMIQAAMAVDWTGDMADGEAFMHNVWHAMSAAAPTNKQIGWFNTKYGTFFRLGELAATDRNSAAMAAGEIIRVYTHPAPAASDGGLREEALRLADRLESAAQLNRNAASEIEMEPESYTPDDAVDVAAGLSTAADIKEKTAGLLRALATTPAPQASTPAAVNHLPDAGNMVAPEQAKPSEEHPTRRAFSDEVLQAIHDMRTGQGGESGQYIAGWQAAVAYIAANVKAPTCTAPLASWSSEGAGAEVTEDEALCMREAFSSTYDDGRYNNANEAFRDAGNALLALRAQKKVNGQ